MGLPGIDPPLINTACPWSTTFDQLKALYLSPHTGAITTRTSLLHGFPHDDNIHQRTFFDTSNHLPADPSLHEEGQIPANYDSSLNTLGYSPLTLGTYLHLLTELRQLPAPPPSPLQQQQQQPARPPRKPFIVSVTGSPGAVLACYRDICAREPDVGPVAVEINLSCPNIPGRPPPAYSGPDLAAYLAALASDPAYAAAAGGGEGRGRRVKVGLKVPPYTYHDQFATLIATLRSAVADAGSGTGQAAPAPPVDFLTSTNTLGNCLLLADPRGSDGSGSVSTLR